MIVGRIVQKNQLPKDLSVGIATLILQLFGLSDSFIYELLVAQRRRDQFFYFRIN